jgi:hypothetical protein
MRQLSLLVATTLAFFIMLSVFLMSRTSSLHESVLDPNTTPPEMQNLGDIATQAAGTSMDVIEAGIEHVRTKTPVTPGLTQGHVIMPPLSNETIKYVPYALLMKGKNLVGRVGSYFILSSLGFPRRQVLMNERH